MKISIKAILFYLSASKVTTLDYKRKIYPEEYSAILEWKHVNDYLDYLLENKLIEFTKDDVLTARNDMNGFRNSRIKMIS